MCRSPVRHGCAAIRMFPRIGCNPSSCNLAWKRRDFGALPAQCGIAHLERSLGVEAKIRLRAPVQRKACICTAGLELEWKQGGRTRLQHCPQCLQGVLRRDRGFAAFPHERMRTFKAEGVLALQEQGAVGGECFAIEVDARANGG